MARYFIKFITLLISLNLYIILDDYESAHTGLLKLLSINKTDIDTDDIETPDVVVSKSSRKSRNTEVLYNKISSSDEEIEEYVNSLKMIKPKENSLKMIKPKENMQEVFNISRRN